MTEAQATISEEMTQPSGGGNESNSEAAIAESLAKTAENPVETGSPVVESVASDSERDDFARSFANLARQEARLRGERDEFNQRRRNDTQEVTQKASDLENLRQIARTDPMQALEALGLSYDGLTRRVINDGKVPLEDKFAQQAREIEELKQTNLNNVQERENRQIERDKKAIYGEMIDKITNLVENNDKYEMIKANNAHHTVYQVMQDQFQRDGKILHFDQAADLVEKYFEDEAERYFKSSKLRERYRGHWQPESEKAQAAEPSQQAAVQQRPNTLSNELTSQVPARGGELLSKEDSLQAAADIIRNYGGV
jgi:hypothetical protein